MLVIGPHVSKTGRKGTRAGRKMHVALAEDLAFVSTYGPVAPCAQIFVAGPKSMRETLSDEEKAGVLEYVRAHNAVLVIHGSYLDTAIWGGSETAARCLKQELRVAAGLGATGVVTHLSAASNSDNLPGVVRDIETLPDTVLNNVVWWLETNSAKPRATTFETPAKLGALVRRIRAVATKLRVGVCVDTAHLFACGVALDSAVAATRWIEEFEREVGPPVMFHLNDSKTPLGSGKDIHEVLCNGMIWKSYHPTDGNLPVEESGLVTILNYCARNRCPVILERDDDDLCHDLSLLQRLRFME
jgi:endonuclease IV